MIKILFTGFLFLLGCSHLPNKFSYVENNSNIIRKTITLNNSEKEELITHIEFFNSSNPKTLQLYISKLADRNDLKITINYYGNEYIDFQELKIFNSNEKIEFNPTILDKIYNKRNDGSIFEKAELKLNKKETKQLKNIFKNPFIILLSGKTKKEFDFLHCNHCIELIEFYENSNPTY